MKFALLFPGQGSQSVGMGQALAEAFAPSRRVFEEVDDALYQRLSRLIWDGPESDLTLTANAQPALMAVSLAAIAALKHEFGLEPARAAAMAGHSLGEYSALCASGAFTLTDTARLLRKRGEAMQDAVPVGEGAMASLIGKVDLPLAEEIAREGEAAGVCVVANDNNAGNIVISGDKAAVEAAIAAAKTRGVRAILLNVSAPFHSPLMQPAARIMQDALDEAAIAPPATPIYMNVTAKPCLAAGDVRPLLVAQVTGRVRWRESVEAMAADGIETFVEVGAGKVLTGMVKRIAPDARTFCLNEPADLEAFAKAL